MLPNRFYNDFDIERLRAASRTPDYRSPFQVDRDRIIYSQAFRHLQTKTQVFLAGEYDFYRTRLTHSIEVAQIGRSICQYLLQTSELLQSDYCVDSALVEAICLAHDLGHPPFGHGGERELNALMRDQGGFEANAQTVRILTELLFFDPDGPRGANPTRALLDGVMKVKHCYTSIPDHTSKFLYDDQEACLAFVHGPDHPHPGGERPASLECQIMDWADDTAYSLNDVVDGITAGLITSDNVEKLWNTGLFKAGLEEACKALLEALHAGRHERLLARKIGEFIRACRLVSRSNSLSTSSNRYAYGLEVAENVRRECEFYKQIAVELVFQVPALQQIEYKATRILREIFQAFNKAYSGQGAPALRLLPPRWERLLREEKEPQKQMRRLCDYLAGLTDGAALRTYKRLFDPDYSVRDEHP